MTTTREPTLRPARLRSLLRLDRAADQSSGTSSSDTLLPPNLTLAIRPFWGFVAFWLVWNVWIVLRGLRPLPVHWGFTSLTLLGTVYIAWLMLQQKSFHDRLVAMLADDTGPAPRGSRPATFATFTAGLLLVGANLTMLEVRQPYYFTQDDNLAQFLPIILHGGRAVTQGEFSTWNAHQFLGAPTASIGTYALTYPPTYLAYFAATNVLGDEFATLEVFCLAHLLVAYATSFAAARAWGLRPSLAFILATCYTLSGFFLIVGRSWYYMTPTATFLPLFVILLERLRHGAPGWKWVTASACCIGVLFHAGNAQMWLYAVFFFVAGFAIMAASGATTWRSGVALLTACVMGGAIALPLLVPQMIETATTTRHLVKLGIENELPALFLPWPLTEFKEHGLTYTPYNEFTGQLSYSGTVLSLAALPLLFSCVLQRWPRRVWAANMFVPLALLALVLATGVPGGIWLAAAKLPVLNKFSLPVKYLPFVTLFLLLAGGIAVERLLRRAARPRLAGLALSAAATTFISWHAWLCWPSLFSYSFAPYPELPAAITSTICHDPTQRFLALAPKRSLDDKYFQALPHNLPTVYGGLAVGGYDPLVSENAHFRQVGEELYSADGPTAALAAYGVKWLLVFPEREMPYSFAPPQTRPVVVYPPLHPWFYLERYEKHAVQLLKDDTQTIVDSHTARLLELPHADPLAFANNDTSEALPIEFHAWGARVDLAGHAESSADTDRAVTVNVLSAPFFKAVADGVSLPVDADDWNRVVVQVPAGAQSLELRYSPPWFSLSAVGLVLCGAAALVFARFGRPPAASPDMSPA